MESGKSHQKSNAKKTLVQKIQSHSDMPPPVPGMKKDPEYSLKINAQTFSKFNFEMKQHVQTLQISSMKIKQRENLIFYIKNKLNEELNVYEGDKNQEKIDFDIQVCGSFPCGLSTLNSDLNFQVQGLKFRQILNVFESDQRIKIPKLGKEKKDPKKLILVDEQNKVNFDVTCTSFYVSNRHTRICKMALKRYPNIFNVYHCMKAYLVECNYNTSKSGGISSYLLFYMILAFYQNYDHLFPNDDLSKKQIPDVVKFLHFYSEFDHYKFGIEIELNDLFAEQNWIYGDKNQSLIPKVKLTGVSSKMFYIKNPVDFYYYEYEGHASEYHDNISAQAINFEEIKNEFKNSYTNLMNGKYNNKICRPDYERFIQDNVQTEEFPLSDQDPENDHNHIEIHIKELQNVQNHKSRVEKQPIREIGAQDMMINDFAINSNGQFKEFYGRTIERKNDVKKREREQQPKHHFDSEENLFLIGQMDRNENEIGRNYQEGDIVPDKEECNNLKENYDKIDQNDHYDHEAAQIKFISDLTAENNSFFCQIKELQKKFELLEKENSLLTSQIDKERANQITMEKRFRGVILDSGKRIDEIKQKNNELEVENKSLLQKLQATNTIVNGQHHDQKEEKQTELDITDVIKNDYPTLPLPSICEQDEISKIQTHQTQKMEQEIPKVLDTLQSYFEKLPSGYDHIKLDFALVEMYQKLGYLNLKKLIDDSMLKFDKELQIDECFQIGDQIQSNRMVYNGQVIRSLKQNGGVSFIRKAIKAHGITRCIISDTIIEGQFEDDLENGLCRVIWLSEYKYQNDDSLDDILGPSFKRVVNTYFGWMKDGKKHGFGKYVYHDATMGQIEQYGLFENDCFSKDGNVSYDTNAKYAQKFNEQDYIL